MPKGQYPRTDTHRRAISKGMIEACLQHSPETRRKISDAIKTIRLVKKNQVKIENAKAITERRA